MRQPKLYPAVHDGERIAVKWRTDDYLMACCDCHLVHRLRFWVKPGKVELAAWRDKRRTAQLRRRRGRPQQAA